VLKFITEKVSSRLLSILVGASLPILSSVAIYFRNELTLWIKDKDPETIAIIMITLGITCLALLAWVLYFLPSFKYIQKLQVYQHHATGFYYCPTCRDKKPLSPLRFEKAGWRCPFKECRAFYKDPDHQPPPEPPTPSGPHSWMAN